MTAVLLTSLALVPRNATTVELDPSKPSPGGRIGKTAPDFALPNRSGRWIPLADFLGEKSCFSVGPLGAGAAGAPTQFVNPFIGTDQALHTFPGAAFPFGMVQLSPDTGGNHGLYLMSDWKWCAGYHYSDRTIMGFSHLHRSGMGVGDWGDILIMPTVGAIQTGPGEEDIPGSGYRSRFSHEREKALPGYYAVKLDDSGIFAELTVGPRTGFHRYTFPASEAAHVLIDLGHGLGDAPLFCRIKITGNSRITGTRTSTGLIPFQKVHFCADFNKPFDSFGVWNSAIKKPGVRFETGSRIGAFVNYRTRESEVVVIKVGLSFTSEEEACQNLEADLKHRDFDQVRKDASQAWDRELSKIKVEPGPLDPPAETRDRMTVFYTALYHAFLFPAVFSDADGSYSPMGNAPGQSRQAHDFTYYSDYSTWDTFRAEMPLLFLVQPERSSDMVRTLVRHYEDSGWLVSPNEFGNYHSEGMTGDPNAIVILDAFLKGLRGFDPSVAYAAMRKNAVTPGRNVLPMIGFGKGRWGLIPYEKLGYVPADDNLAPKNPLFITAYIFNQGASRTLEYSYADFCVSWMAKELGKPEDHEYFRARSLNYQNVLDPETGFVRGRSITGKWMNSRDFDPTAYYAYYTEGNAWQWTWSVFHDVAGLIALLGGRERFNQKLDRFFGGGTDVKAYQYFSVHVGGQIGQYAHGNEPSHHAAYLYDFSGQPWKTQELARRIMDDFYQPTPEGLAGNEDMGQMSAWFVVSSLGLYPFCPGIYVIGSPCFARAEVEMKDGKTLLIEAVAVSSANKYIQSATINGLPLNRPWLKHSELANGATLNFVMGPAPNPQWGNRPEDAPPSLDRLEETDRPGRD